MAAEVRRNAHTRTHATNQQDRPGPTATQIYVEGQLKERVRAFFLSEAESPGWGIPRACTAECYASFTRLASNCKTILEERLYMTAPGGSYGDQVRAHGRQ